MMDAALQLAAGVGIAALALVIPLLGAAILWRLSVPSCSACGARLGRDDEGICDDCFRLRLQHARREPSEDANP